MAADWNKDFSVEIPQELNFLEDEVKFVTIDGPTFRRVVEGSAQESKLDWFAASRNVTIKSVCVHDCYEIEGLSLHKFLKAKIEIGTQMCRKEIIIPDKSLNLKIFNRVMRLAEPRLSDVNVVAEKLGQPLGIKIYPGSCKNKSYDQKVKSWLKEARTKKDFYIQRKKAFFKKQPGARGKISW